LRNKQFGADNQKNRATRIDKRQI